MDTFPSLGDLQVDAPRSVLASMPACVEHHRVAILVIGGGLAGLSAALRAAEHAEVLLLTRAPLPESNSAWAQGGVAAALDRSDSPALHVEDTLVAGAGLCDPTAVQTLTWEAPALMNDLAALGVPFERAAGNFALGLEGGHSRRRILHVGDTTGWAITRTMIEHARRHPRIQIVEGMQAVDLLESHGRCAGVLARDDSGAWYLFQARATILATGGAGALYGLTSNQPGALGEGIALAYRAGAEVSDMEFVQFHPTVMRTRNGQGFLISEAARGEGGRLLTPGGRRFMPEVDPRAELAPRDIVARAIFRAMREEGADHVLLDLTHLAREYLQERFPTIYARCLAEGIDPAVAPIPVAPAAHFLMGGIRTNLDGATSLPGLYAAGECACTGVHGANRLASNSLLECMVFGRRAAAAALQEDACTAYLAMPELAVAGGPSALAPAGWRDALSRVMREQAGIQRTGAELAAALEFLATLPLQADPADAATITAANAALAARLIVVGALLREESRGGHYRADYPNTDERWRVHLVQQRGRPARLVETVASLAVPRHVPVLARQV